MFFSVEEAPVSEQRGERSKARRQGPRGESSRKQSLGGMLFTKAESMYGFFGAKVPRAKTQQLSSSVQVCSGVFYSCAKEMSHQEPLLEKKFGIKV